MAVVTEPPWVNQSSGVAARNGTTSHTVPFGFTSTSGSFLVFVVYGSVTHTASGWTKQLGPVNSGELSVFTKTSAGDSSITVTHNASNYPTPWAAYEFPAGTTWTAGASDAVGTADTFPALTGLPGTEVVVFGSRGRAAASTASTAASSTVSAPWVEDADQFAVDDGTTDGGYLYVTHQINVTATSATPSAATTYTGSWGTADRQHVVFALNVAASGGGTTVVSKDVASTWNAAAIVTKSVTTTWATSAVVTKNVATSWDTAAAVSKPVATSWDVAAQVSKPVATAWAVAATVSKAVATTWNVAGVVTKSVGTSWDVDATGQVAKSVATTWDVAAVTSKAVATGWNVATVVTKSAATSWDTTARVAKTVATMWAVDGSPTAGVVVRPFTGTTARPNTGVTVRP